MSRDQQFNFMAVMCVLLGILVVLLSINSRDGDVYEEDFRALQEAYDELYEEHEVLKDGYNELQQDYSRKTEQIEYLENRIMSDDGISEELKQEIKENVPEEGK